jgi:hypothetical protein
MAPGVVLRAAVTPSSGSDRPGGGLVDADFLVELGADRRQVLGEDVGRAAAVATGDDVDGLVGQVGARVGVLDGGVVPLGDVSHEDAGVDLARQLEVLDLRQVVDDNDGAGGHGQQDGAALGLADLLVVFRLSRIWKNAPLGLA